MNFEEMKSAIRYGKKVGRKSGNNYLIVYLDKKKLVTEYKDKRMKRLILLQKIFGQRTGKNTKSR